MILMTYRFQVEWQGPAGPNGEEREINVEVETDDIDQAYELAERFLTNGVVELPAGTVMSSLRILSN